MWRLLTLFVLAGVALTDGAAPPRRAAEDRAADVAAIRQHIDTIFKAYMAGDLATIRATHAADWRGFLTASRQIVRGIDDYMATAEGSLEGPYRLVGYEMLDFDVQLDGDFALVSYVAATDREVGGVKLPYRPVLRVLDVYARRDGEWIQVGSNTALHPDSQAALRRLPAPVSPALRDELLAAREAVWRAWFAGDRTALERLVPPELVAIDAGADAWSGHDEVLAAAGRFADEGGKLVELDFPHTEIQLYGDVAILYTRYALTLETGAGERRSLAGRGTEVFVRRDAGWVNAGWHLDSGS